MYTKAKKFAYADLETTTSFKVSLPWVTNELEETQQLLGEDYWRYGIKANEKALETLFQYSFERHCQTNLTEPA